jgi:prepilin-type N-terminal cleavage/methylation domain-containing protein
MTRRGFTLVEVLVALVVLEVGLLGVVGTLLLAATTMARARLLEAGVAAMERAYDSLQLAPGAGSGGGATEAGGIRWLVEGGGNLLIEVRGPGDTLLAAVHGRLAGAGGTP